MEMLVTFPGGKKVNAEFDGMMVATDQPPASGGEGSAPTPFDYFLASIATCAGIYVLGFCTERGIPTDRLSLRQQTEFSDAGGGKKRLAKVLLEIRLPPDFPEKYRNAIVKTAELCAAKKAILNPPEFEISVFPV